MTDVIACVAACLTGNACSESEIPMTDGQVSQFQSLASGLVHI